MTTTWKWPGDWLSTVLPRRSGGGKLGGAPEPPPVDLAVSRDVFASVLKSARSWLEHDGHEPRLHAAALKSLDCPPAERTPWGTAALLTMRVTDDDTWAPVVDHLLAEHGAVFAAATLAEMAGQEFDWSSGQGRRLGYFRGWTYRTPQARWASLARRLRIRLVDVSDAKYVRVVAAIAFYRTGVFTQRCLTSYLAPDQSPWVAADCADAVALGQTVDAQLLFGAASTVEQFRQVGAHYSTQAGVETVGGVATVLDVLGVDAVPVLEKWAGGRSTRETLQPIWTALAALPSDEALATLFRKSGSRYAMPYVRRAMDRDPERAMRVLARSDESDLLRDHVLTRTEVAVRMLPELDDDAARRIRVHLDPLLDPLLDPDAAEQRVPAADLPPLLHRPPWTEKKRVKRVTVAGLEAKPEAAMAWLPGEREERAPNLPAVGPEPAPEQVEELLAGQVDRYDAERLLATWPEETLRPVLDRVPIEPREYDFQDNDAQWIVAARFGADALPSVLAAARKGLKFNIEPLMPFAATEVAVAMADWYDRLVSVRAVARAWFGRHPEVAARALVPPALGRAGRDRRQAERVLLMLAAAGFEAEVRTAAAGYGPEAGAGIDTLLRTDPLRVLPARIPALPTWLDPRLLPPLRVPDGRALPVEAVGHVCTVLAMSTMDEPYPGVDVVRATCDPASLEAFGWALYDRWDDAGFPVRERWILGALGLIGGDDTADRLVPLIVGWPSGNARTRASLGLDVLCAIGTDKALMHLDRLARKADTDTVAGGARERIDAIAAARELTPEQLADRLVPDFDLDPDGRMTLDYGPRTFVVGFDEQLRPFAADGAGKRLKTLPKPGVRDDPQKAATEYKRFAALKRTVRTIAAEQVRRFEHAMVWQRRWPASELATLFAVHPLLQHLVRRLVWGVYEGDETIGAFRIAEDRTYADVADDPYEVADDAVVGVAHPLHLGADLPAWAETFADYEILQPFAQLGRETYDSTEPLDRYRGRTTTGGRALGLRNRGWDLDDDHRGGRSLDRLLPGGLQAYVVFTPGMNFLDGFDPKETQTVESIGVYRLAGALPGQDSSAVGVDELDPVTRSEVLRDLTQVLG
ncbi:DUF4132 domain-containing protein [Virgisporangium aurantiacum]|uniref:DUF4132 domain-containing protein n=1 Tax=Virgisporangium aurantiacum TaxID=175570 RepID=A0A8J3ZFA0_9ACTN|nr:DUF4132 domain-containing protein [Virgisporangium aurantiacum]GIJ60750.1 hypothetical protein Vau01_082660 [Virgisporangium aurantiacum]